MGVGEPHAFAGKSIDVGRFDLGLGVVAAQVAVAEVVGEDEEDVGFGRFVYGLWIYCGGART